MSAYQQVFLPTAWGKSTREPSVPGAFFMGPSDLQRQPKTDSLSGAQKKNPQDQNGPRGSRNGSEPLETDSVWVAVIGHMGSEPKGEWSGPVAGELRETTPVVVEEVAEIPLALGD